MSPVMENATNAGSPQRAANQRARNALAPYTEGGAWETAGNADALTTYQWLDLYGSTVRASVVDLEIE